MPSTKSRALLQLWESEALDNVERAKGLSVLRYQPPYTLRRKADDLAALAKLEDPSGAVLDAIEATENGRVWPPVEILQRWLGTGRGEFLERARELGW